MDLKYFILDIFCIDDVKDVVDIFDIENNTIMYKNIYAHERIKCILSINNLFHEIYKIQCSAVFIRLFMRLFYGRPEDIIECVSKYLIRFSFIKYTIKENEISDIVVKAKKYRDSLSIYSERELCNYIEKRHSIKLNYRETTFKSYTLAIKNKYNSSVKDYFNAQKNDIETFNLLKMNPLDRSFNSTNTVIYNSKYLLKNDCINYHIVHDCYFSRMLHDNIGIYIDSVDAEILEYLYDIIENSIIQKRPPVIFSTTDIIKYLQSDEKINKFNFIPFYIEQFTFLEAIPKIWLKIFITTRYSPDTNIGKINYIISDAEDIPDNIPNMFNLVKYETLKNNTFLIPESPELRGVFFNLVTHASIRHLYGFDKIMKYVKTRNISLEDSIQKINNASPNCIMIADNRENIMDVISLMITLYNLENKKWTVVFIGSCKSINYMKKVFGNNIEYIHEPRFEKTPFDIEIYNDIMKDYNTWKSLEKYHKCLVIQDDGMIIKKGLERSIFMTDTIDYVGAPWKDAEYNKEIKDKCGHLCGNGGISLRNIEIMKNVTEKYSNYKNELFNNSLQTLPEDVFFAKYVKQIGGRIPNEMESQLFASEQVHCLESFGFHKIWAYANFDFVNNFLK
jgi:hypothetical protein